MPTRITPHGSSGVDACSRPLPLKGGALCLSGWGQPHDALAVIAPDATHIDYAHHAVEQALEAIAAAGHHDRVIGWSLGGQLAVRAISHGIIKPKQLVLIAVPFQFVKNEALPLGMPRDTYDQFKQNYSTNPKRTLNKAWELISYGDVRDKYVREQLAKHDKNKVLQADWWRWLHDLEKFSCEGLTFDAFPPTLLIHGDKDAVVWTEQSERFAGLIDRSTLEIWPGCGHAPHWHDTDKLKKLIETHV
jgi:pimeloyl-[acyl-carrier protein] methyl ester esterase